MKKVTSKIQKTASNIGFLNQSLNTNICENKRFISTKDKHQAERRIIKRHLKNHHSNIKSPKINHEELISYLLQILGKIILRNYVMYIAKSLHMNNLRQLKTKSKKIYHLKPKNLPRHYQVPIINLPDFEIDTICLKYELHHFFMDKNRFIKRELGVERESLASSVDTFVPQENKEEFHQFLRNTTYKLSNVYRTKDRGGSRTGTTSKAELFVIIVNGVQLLTIIKKSHLGCCSSPRSTSERHVPYD